MTYAAEPVWTGNNPKPEYTKRERASLAIKEAWETGDERGYFAIQSTKVQT